MRLQLSLCGGWVEWYAKSFSCHKSYNSWVSDNTTKVFSQQPELVPSIILHIMVFLLGVVGHTLLLLYLLTTHKERNINTGMFMVSLSVADLLMLVVYIPLEVTKDLITQELRGGVVCKVKEYIKMLTALASVINMVAVSFERYNLYSF